MKLKTMIVHPGQDPKIELLNAHAKQYEAILGASFTAIPLNRSEFPGILCYFSSNVAGKFLNRSINGQPIYGTFLITKMDGGGTSIDLSVQDIERLMRYLTGLNKNLKVQ